jgi:hypothetical protein
MKALVNQACPSWCFKTIARSWACETPDCSPCLDACLSTKLPVPAVNKSSRPMARIGWQETWSCAPRWPPRKMFVMFSMGRSASTAACSIVNTLPNAHCSYELLNPGLVTRYPEDQRALMSTDPAEFVMQQFASTVSSRGKAPCAWGFKLFETHTYNASFHRWLWGHLSAAVVLRRDDGVPMPHGAACQHHC